MADRPVTREDLERLKRAADEMGPAVGYRVLRLIALVEEQQSMLDLWAAAFEKMRMVSLPPNDVSGRRMWDEAIVEARALLEGGEDE